jgi:hypothetical protein
MKKYEMIMALGEVEKCIYNSGQITRTGRPLT